MNAEFACGQASTSFSATTEQGRLRCCERWRGWLIPRAETISILGKNPQEACREIGYMAHPSLLYDEMSGMENLRYFARLYDIAGDDRCEQVIRSVRA